LYNGSTKYRREKGKPFEIEFDVFFACNFFAHVTLFNQQALDLMAREEVGTRLRTRLELSPSNIDLPS